MENWQTASLISLVIYGFWAFSPKIAVSFISPQSALVYEVAGSLLVGLGMLFFLNFQLESQATGILFAMLTGIAGMAGTLFFLFAAVRGKISIVVSITALYPLVTIILAAVFLREPLSARQLLGMAFALFAIVLLTS